MESNQYHLIFFFNQQKKDAIIPEGITEEQLRATIDELFHDSNCHCVAVRYLEKSEVVPLYSVPNVHNLLEDLQNYCSDYLYVISDRRSSLFP